MLKLSGMPFRPFPGQFRGALHAEGNLVLVLRFPHMILPSPMYTSNSMQAIAFVIADWQGLLYPEVDDIPGERFC